MAGDGPAPAEDIGGARYSLTMRQRAALRHCMAFADQNHGEVPDAVALAGLLRMSQSGARRMLQDLVRRGWLTRHPSSAAYAFAPGVRR